MTRAKREPPKESREELERRVGIPGPTRAAEDEKPEARDRRRTGEPRTPAAGSEDRGAEGQRTT